MARTKDILEVLNTIAPFDIAEDWDNSGLQAGSLNWEVKKIMIGLDVSIPLMTAAKKWDCDLVLTHHPLMIQAENSIDFDRMPGKAIEIAARQKMSIISAHTNLDKAVDGLNDFFAEKIGVGKTTVFVTQSPSFKQTDKMMGIGRVGDLEKATTLEYLVQRIKQVLNLSHLRVTGDMDLPVKTVAICTGSGGSLVDDFLTSGASVYITGDVKYHEARRVEECSKAILDVGHFASEHMAIDLLSDKLSLAAQTAGFNIQIKKYKKEKDPFTIV